MLVLTRTIAIGTRNIRGVVATLDKPVYYVSVAILRKHRNASEPVKKKKRKKKKPLLMYVFMSCIYTIASRFF